MHLKENIILEIILDALVDSLKMVPFLFLAYLLMEYIEHRASKKADNVLNSSKKLGPLTGALIGIFPQCGFSVAAANLYTGGIITAGTLIAVFISTSDEAIPVLLANPGQLGMVMRLILIKVLIAVLVGSLVDMIMKRRTRITPDDVVMTEHHHDCHGCCAKERGIFIAALGRTLSTFVFIFIVSLLLSILISFLGLDRLGHVMLSGTIFQPIITALIGFIPNCAASVVLIQMYLAGTISFGSVVAGLCTGAGVGLLVLLRENRNLKDNLTIMAVLFLSGSIAGMIIQALF